jgi:hypothetical protein
VRKPRFPSLSIERISLVRFSQRDRALKAADTVREPCGGYANSDD